MKHTRVIPRGLLFAFLMASSGCVSPPKTPTHEGKSLSYWLVSLPVQPDPALGHSTNVFAVADGSLHTNSFSEQELELYLGLHPLDGKPPVRATEDNTRAKPALLAMGTNAIPGLLHLLRTREWQFRNTPTGFARQHGISNIRPDYRNSWYELAADGFRVLGAAASNAVPELIQIFEQNTLTSAQWAVACAVCSIGPPAVPAVIKRLELPGHRTAKLRSPYGFSSNTKVECVHWLAYLQPSPDVVLPPLIKALQDADPNVRYAAAFGLWRLEDKAGPAVPALVNALNDQYGLVRAQASCALVHLSPAEPQLLPVLIKALDEPDMDVQMRAISGLLTLGPAAKPAASRLAVFLSAADDGLRLEAASALAKIAPETQGILPRLRQALQMPNSRPWSSRLMAIIALGDLAPHSSEAVSELKRLLQGNDGMDRYFAGQALEDAGLAAAQPK